MSTASDASAAAHPTAPAEHPQPRRHRWLLWWIAGAATGIVVTLLASVLIVSPWDEARANAAKRIVVSAPVEERSYTPTMAGGTGVISLGTTIELVPTAPDGPAVVTQHPLKAGDIATPGDALIDISGRPVILLRLPFPLYRDLTPGIRGEDVTAVQRHLTDLGLYAGAIDGSYGPRTSAAVEALYRAASRTPPPSSPDLTEALTEAQAALTASEAPADSPERRAAEDAVSAARAATATPLPRAEILAVPHDRLTVTQVSAVGTVLEGDATAVTLLGGAPLVTMHVPATERSAFSIDAPVVITSTDDATATTTGTVTAVGEFQQPSDTSPGGFEITITIDGPTDGFVPQGSVRVTPVDAVTEQRALMIPLTALREQDGQQYVHLASTVDGETAVGPRIEIETGDQVDGYVIVTAGDLTAGQAVVVSTRGTDP